MAHFSSGFFPPGANPQLSTPITFVPTLWQHYNHIESSIENGPEIDRNQCKVLLDQLKVIMDAADRCAQRNLGAVEIQQLNNLFTRISNYFLSRRNQDWSNIIYQRRVFNQSLAPFISELDRILIRFEGFLREGRFRKTLELIEAARKVDDQSMDEFNRELNNISRGAYSRAYEAQDSAQLKTLTEDLLQGQSSLLSLDQELQDEARQNAGKLTDWIMKITKMKPKGNVILGRRLTGDWTHKASTEQYEIYVTRFVSGEHVVIKMLRNRLVGEDIATRLSRFQRQINIWYDLRYDHILPLYGIGMKTESSGENFVYCVSPFMRNGNAVEYIKSTCPSVQQRLKIVLHVANALRYLHEKDEPIVRFNVCSQNVLIDDDGCGVLGGMGFSKETISPDGNPNTYSMGLPKGSSVFIAPEYLKDPDCPRKTSADVWSWAMVALELIGGKTPFHETRGGYQLISLMIEGGRPNRDLYEGIKELAEPDLFWRLLEDCWAADESERPDMYRVFKAMKDVMAKESQFGRRDPAVVPAPRPRRTEGSFSEPVDGPINQGTVQGRDPSRRQY